MPMRLQNSVKRLAQLFKCNMEEIVLQQIMSAMRKYSVEARLDQSFCQLTTFGTGGKIAVTLYPDTIPKLNKVVKLLEKLKATYCILGKGSNVLAADCDYDGVVVLTTRLSSITFKGNCVYVLAGTSTVTLGKELQARGLSGGEFLSCLPATVGGAVVGNAGCFGQDIEKILVGVEILHNGKRKWLSKSKCKLKKRGSIFKEQNGYVALAAKFKFTQSTVDEVKCRVNDMRNRKAASQPLNYRSAGSVFFHDNVAVSRLIDQAGLKGYTVGGAQVSNKHAGFILNVDKATSKDIYLVMQHVETTLWERYGVRVKREVQLINFTKENDDIFSKR